MNTPRSSFALLAVAALALPAAASAVCTPDAGSLGVHFLDLNLLPAGEANQTLYGGAPATTLLKVGKSACSGSKSALVEVKVPDGCTEARIWVEYEGTPKGWTLNVGDSSGDNGFGGDAGQPDSEAELQVLGENLTVFTKGLGPGIVDPLAQAHLALTDGALEVVVRDQYLSWGQPFTALDTADSQLLFALPDAGATAGKENVFYLGVNRVVSGPSGRVGCGARRVIVSFR